MWQMPFRMGLGGALRFYNNRNIARLHRKPRQHRYLLALGVRPEQQQGGIGSTLIELGASQAQKAGMPVYLETTTRSNVDFYSKRGFEIVEEFDNDDRLHTWVMLRKPE